MGDDALEFVSIRSLQACRIASGAGGLPQRSNTCCARLAAVIAMDSRGLQDPSAQFLGDCCAEDVFEV